MTNTDIAVSDFWNNRCCLVAGGLGLIGTELTRKLLDAGAIVQVIDSAIADIARDPNWIADPRVKLHRCDVREPGLLASVLPQQQVVFNLIGLPGHLQSLKNPNADLDANLLAPIAVLQACLAFAPDLTQVFASSRQIYGRPRHLPVDEAHPCAPIDLNAVHRLAAEQHHVIFSQVHALPVRILRLGNIVGHGLHALDARQSFLAAWLGNLRAGRPIEVWGGEQERELLDVDDACEALMLAAEKQLAPGSIFNIAGAEAIRLKDLAQRVVKLAGSGEFVVRPMPAHAMQIELGSFRTDISRARRELGWEPRQSIDEILQCILQVR